MKKWCSTYWLYTIYAMGVIALLVLVKNWTIWNDGEKLLALMAILLPIHVAEEWKLPGGFHYAYNLLRKSDSPNCYPMNQLTDMLTNFMGEIFFFVLISIGATTGILLAMACFCYIETIGHTLLSAVIDRQFKHNGKRIIYTPGLFTAYCGFLIVGIVMTIHLVQTGIQPKDIGIAIGILLIMIVGMICIPENLFKSKETKYPFPSSRYFRKF